MSRTILDMRNNAIDAYESALNDNERERLKFAICHFDDMIITMEISCLGSSEHKPYISERPTLH